jgi:hypothetical protein
MGPLKPRLRTSESQSSRFWKLLTLVRSYTITMACAGSERRAPDLVSLKRKYEGQAPNLCVVPRERVSLQTKKTDVGVLEVVVDHLAAERLATNVPDLERHMYVARELHAAQVKVGADGLLVAFAKILSAEAVDDGRLSALSPVRCLARCGQQKNVAMMRTMKATPLFSLVTVRRVETKESTPQKQKKNSNKGSHLDSASARHHQAYNQRLETEKFNIRE